MCEHNFNTEYVSTILNYSSPESLSFSSWPNGAHPSEVPQLCGRREVCSLPWTSPSSCTIPSQSLAFRGYSQPRFTNSLTVTDHSKGQSCRVYDQATNFKEGLPDKHFTVCTGEPGTSASASYSKCAISDLEKRLQSTVAHAGVNSRSNRIIDGTENSSVPIHLSPSSQNTSAALTDGFPWCSAQVRAKKKRKPYTKPQLSELENEFMINEFINRQKRKELSDRLDLSDQQVKIWFQNRRMKKKRLLMREHAFSIH